MIGTFRTGRRGKDGTDRTGMHRQASLAPDEAGASWTARVKFG